MSTAPTQYHKVAKWLHWLMALLIIGLLVLGLVMEDISPLATRINAVQLHKSFGITVLVLAIARLGWRLAHPAPDLPEGMKPHERWLAHAGHWGLYAVMIIMPASGWLMAWASKYPTMFFLIEPLPAIPFPEGISQKAVQGLAHSAHEISTIYVAIPLIALHLIAALYHQYVRKDNLMQRMLPQRNK